MSWRTVVIRSKAKLSYQNDYMIVRGEELNMIHLSEINTLIIDSTAVNVTAYLLCEMVKNKIKIIFCDEKRNPYGEIIPYYGRHNTSKTISNQLKWSESFKKKLFTEIVRNKIINQACLLKKLKSDRSYQVFEFAESIELNDYTNREGHAAKVYFNSLFGKDFFRDSSSGINAILDYGYAILLSTFNKEITSCGYLTQLGIKHCNEYNHFNLTSDLMEPFRVVIDEMAEKFEQKELNEENRKELIDLLNKKIDYDSKEYYLINAVQAYVKNFFRAIEEENLNYYVPYYFK